MSLVIGVLWGAVAGYVGGRWDSLLMRVVDIMYSMPSIVFVIVLITTLETYVAPNLDARPHLRMLIGENLRVVAWGKSSTGEGEAESAKANRGRADNGLIPHNTPARTFLRRLVASRSAAAIPE